VIRRVHPSEIEHDGFARLGAFAVHKKYVKWALELLSKIIGTKKYGTPARTSSFCFLWKGGKGSCDSYVLINGIKKGGDLFMRKKEKGWCEYEVENLEKGLEATGPRPKKTTGGERLRYSFFWGGKKNAEGEAKGPLVRTRIPAKPARENNKIVPGSKELTVGFARGSVCGGIQRVGRGPHTKGKRSGGVLQGDETNFWNLPRVDQSNQERRGPSVRHGGGKRAAWPPFTEVFLRGVLAKDGIGGGPCAAVADGPH